MRRWLLYFAVFLSLLLCAATAVLWVRGFPRYDSVGFRLRSAESAKEICVLGVSNPGEWPR
jgi:hypothetical protein